MIGPREDDPSLDYEQCIACLQYHDNGTETMVGYLCKSCGNTVRGELS